VGGLVQASDGNFYGTTTAGGSTNAGVIYQITAQGTYKVVLSFDNRHPLGGYQSYAGLVAGANGELYGVTIWGGTSGDGVIFSVTTSGGYSVRYNFGSPAGTGAYATPVQDTNGFLYGMTNRGGGRKNRPSYAEDPRRKCDDQRRFHRRGVSKPVVVWPGTGDCRIT
jgi:uncharacterized repeat protein (TIGR03803 family)